MTKEARNIQREVLPNGLTILSEEMEHIRSVSIGIWIKTGSREEDPQWNGISHFIEHMVFKGTESRSAEDIARQVDSIGGNMDAFTGKETICFNIKVLDEHLPIAIDILSDLVLNPTFDHENFSQAGRCLSVVSLALLLESATQIWSRTRLRVALGARPQSLSGSRVSLWHDRPEKFSVESRVAVAGYGARVPTQRLSLLRRYKLSHAPETRRSCRQGRSVGCLATERSVQRL